MSYSPLRPNPLSSPALDVQQMEDNFAALDTTLSINHVALNLDDQGKHKFVTFTEQASYPAILLKEFGIFNASDGTNDQLYLRKNSSAATLTGDVNLTGAIKAKPGWCMLPSGIILKWGTGTITAGTGGAAVNATDLVFGTGIPTITTVIFGCANVQGTGKVAVCWGGSFSEVNHTVSVYGYSLGSTSHQATFNYLLLGV